MAALLSMVCALVQTPDLRAQSQASPFSDNGRWLDAGHQGVVGTHVAVMRDPDDDTTKVFLFGGSGTGQLMKLFAFQAGATAVLPSSTNLIPVSHPAGDVTLLDLFCAGHVVLPDGRMLLAGGEAWSPMGIERGFRFDPRYPSNSVPDPWSHISSLAQERWYPTFTVLPSGKVLASSGNQNNYLLSFGGVDETGALKDSLHHMAVTNRSYWMSNSNAGTRPAARRWHSFIGDASRGMVYGGKNGGTSFGDVWYVARNAESDSAWTWQQMEEAETAARGRAAARSRHAMVPWRTPGGPDSTWLGGFVFGGLDTLGNALDDLWYGQRNPNVYPGLWKWTNLTPSPRPADWPSARYGHVTILDPGPPGASRPRILVFGGREQSGALASNEVWAYDINAQAFYRPPIGTPEGAPAEREGHVGVYEDCAGQCQRTIYASSAARRMTFFGGQGASALLGDLWGLWRLDQGPSDTTYTWDAMALSGAQGTPAAARTQMSGTYDQWGDRLTIFGGDLNGEATSGGQTDEVVQFELRDAITSAKTRWNRPPLRTPDFPSHHDPRPRSGHVAIFDASPRVARFPEVFDPAHADTGSWVTAHVSGDVPPIQELYPLMFVLPNGKVFHGGPRDHTDPYKYLFDPATSLWDAAMHSSSYSGSSAAMFRPGYVLRGGTHRDGDTAPTPVENKSDSISFDGSATSGWHFVSGPGIGDIDTRANSNLTLLPSGDAVVTGGLSGSLLSSMKRSPRIWSSRTGAWSGDLNPDFHPRNYHSTAILLPDGRVLSTGGERNSSDPTNDARFRISVFEPPYLFDGDALASRPTVSSPGLPATLAPAQRFTVCTPQAATISSVALIKPGAATHGFNQDQRYVPLAFTRVTGANPRLLVTAPPSTNHAPPGDYLLFVVDSANVPAGKHAVPSVGRWVKLQSTGGTDLCDSYRPGKENLAGCFEYETGLVRLGWSSPPEDSEVTGSGPGTEFSLRYSTTSIAGESQWANATPIALGYTPGPEGTAYTKELALADDLYYFRLRTRDDNGNWSVSPQVAVLVGHVDYGECFEGGGGGGGGGGSSARRAGDALAMLPGGGTGASLPNANTLFARPSHTGPTRDLMRLSFDPSDGGPEASVWVSSSPGVRMRLDQVRLLSVDHSGEREAMVSEDGIVTGVVTEVSGMRTPFTLETGGTLELDLGAATTLVLEAARGSEQPRGQRNGVLVQRRVGDAWVTLRRVVPRRSAEPVAVPTGVSTLRLLALEDVRIERLGTLSQVAGAQPTACAMIRATGVAEADVAGALASADAEHADLANGQSVAARFATPAAAEGLTRSWFLAATASFEGSAAEALSRRGTEAAALPLRFALHQNQPNPFARATRIAFDLPRGESVSLEVYDALGRKVRTLASGWRPAGGHRVEWDQRDRSGSLVQPGVYLYRLRAAGSGVVERKLVVLP